jgi:hypothetical protein
MELTDAKLDALDHHAGWCSCAAQGLLEHPQPLERDDMLDGIKDRIYNEPVMTLAVVQAGIALGVGFGLQMTGEQVALSVAFTAAFLGWVARRQVQPV